MALYERLAVCEQVVADGGVGPSLGPVRCSPFTRAASVYLVRDRLRDRGE